MSPQITIILMVSVSCLLVVLLFVIRKKGKKGDPSKEVDKKITQTQKEISDDLNTDIALSLGEDSLGSLDDLNLDEINLEELNLDDTTTNKSVSQLQKDIETDNKEDSNNDLTGPDLSILEGENNEDDPFSDLVELVNRYKFLQGENLEKFEKYLQESNTDKIETLIREKFQAQGKDKASEQAKEVTKKLLSSVSSIW